MIKTRELTLVQYFEINHRPDLKLSSLYLSLPHSCLFLDIIYSFFFGKILFIYSWETHTERQKHRQRDKQTQDSISGPWDHDLSQRQMLNYWATQVPLTSFVKHISYQMLKNINNKVLESYPENLTSLLQQSFSVLGGLKNLEKKAKQSRLEKNSVCQSSSSGLGIVSNKRLPQPGMVSNDTKVGQKRLYLHITKKYEKHIYVLPSVCCPERVLFLKYTNRKTCKQS